MEDKLISFETANLANKAGIKDCMFNGKMITQSLLQKRLRENYKDDVEAYYSFKDNGKRYYQYQINGKSSTKSYNSYEEALEIGLQEALKLR